MVIESLSHLSKYIYVHFKSVTSKIEIKTIIKAWCDSKQDGDRKIFCHRLVREYSHFLVWKVKLAWYLATCQMNMEQ